MQKLDVTDPGLFIPSALFVENLILRDLQINFTITRPLKVEEVTRLCKSKKERFRLTIKNNFPLMPMEDFITVVKRCPTSIITLGV